MSSKEISQQVGLSPQTVDTYVKAAMAKLGAMNRREAARLLVKYEASQELGSPLGPVADATQTGEPEITTETGWRTWLLPPPVGGRTNELNAAQRNYAVLQVAILGAVVVLGLALVLAGALYTFR